jgi:small subunit ribosomal protein S11
MAEKEIPTKVEEKVETKVEEKPTESIKVETKETVKEEPVVAEKAKSADNAEAPTERKKEVAGIAYIHATNNNTIIHITDLSGHTISRISGGMVTKHSRLKSDPTIAMFAAKKAAERAKDVGITSLYIRTRTKTGNENMGSGSHAAVKSLDKAGFKILSVLESTKIPRGGPKKKGGKRGRRV